MRASSVIKIAIRRPYEDVYGFLAEPGNLARWATAPGGDMVHVEGDTWLIDVPAGKVFITLTPRNPHGVLDYHTRDRATSATNSVPVRAYPNGDGTELIMVWRRRPDHSDERFASDLEWVTSDLERLKSLLETTI